MEIKEKVLCAQSGDKEALQEIIQQFKPLVLKQASITFIAGYENEDLIQIGYISIINAVKKFNPDKNSNFPAYVKQAVTNNFYYEIRKKAKERFELSLEAPTDNDIELKDTLSSDINVEEICVNTEQMEILKKALMSLPYKERNLMEVIFNGDRHALKYYADEKGMTYSSCSKLKQRILKKLRNFFK